MTITRRDALSAALLALIVGALALVVAYGILTAYRASVDISAQNTRYRVACVYSGGQMRGMDCVR